MLQLSLRPGEYLTIHGDIVVQLAQLSGSRAFLRVEADRSIPIVRGKVLERSGAPRPECLASLPRSRARKGRDAVYHWSAERERAVRTMEQLLERMEAGDSRGGSPGAAGTVGAPASNCMGGGAVRPNTGPVPQQNSPGRINNHLSLVSPGLANRLK